MPSAKWHMHRLKTSERRIVYTEARISAMGRCLETLVYLVAVVCAVSLVRQFKSMTWVRVKVSRINILNVIARKGFRLSSEYLVVILTLFAITVRVVPSFAGPHYPP